MFRLVNLDNRAALEHDGQWYDLATVSGDAALVDPMVAIARHAELHAVQAGLAAHAPGGLIEPSRLGPPVPYAPKVFGIALNYRAHAAESNMPLPPAPLTFTKFPNCIVGPEADIELRGDAVDWEVELVVVIGTGGRDIAAADAWFHVAGLTLGQDVSDRDVQKAGTPPQFSLGKSFDTYGPIGPALVSVDAFPDPDDIELWCDVAGERKQHSRTNDLIFGVRELIAYLSSICTLTPGDLIFTGTPSGVGMATGRFLQAGELVESHAVGIGTLRNRCVQASR